MKSMKLAMLAAALLFASAGTSAQQKTPSQIQSECQAMVGARLEAARSDPVVRQRDRRAARDLIEKMDRLVQENRARGVAECETLAALNKLVARQ